MSCLRDLGSLALTYLRHLHGSYGVLRLSARVGKAAVYTLPGLPLFNAASSFDSWT
jgi:hypothetical protein